MSPGGALGACKVVTCCSAKAALGAPGGVLRLRLTGPAILPVIKAARFPDAPRSGTLTVRASIFAPAVREQHHLDPQNQPKPNAVTIATVTMQRARVALPGVTTLMLLIQPPAV